MMFPKAEVVVKQVLIKPGQVITVWLGDAQVELRVLPDGTKQIFTHSNTAAATEPASRCVEFLSFAQWKPMQREEEEG